MLLGGKFICRVNGIMIIAFFRCDVSYRAHRVCHPEQGNFKTSTAEAGE